MNAEINQYLEILKTIADHLESRNIPYMVTGSMAMNFYAVPRMTRDIDVVVELKSEDVDSLADLFEKDFYFDKQMAQDEIKKSGMFNIIHNKAIVKVDFIIRKESEYRKLEFNRRRKVSLENVHFWIVSPEDLILSKLFWAKDSLSEMQLGDIKNISRTVPKLDQKYIENWVPNLGLADIYRRAKE